MPLLSLTTRLLFAMSLAVIFFGKDPGDARMRASHADERVAKAEATAVPPKSESDAFEPESAEFEVASIGSLDGILAPAEPAVADVVTADAMPTDIRYVVGTPVMFDRRMVRTDYAKADAPADMRMIDVKTSDTQGSLDLVYVSGSRVNLRQGPGTDTSVVATLRRGDAAEIIGEAGDGWMNIREVKSGSVGYMSADFLTASQP
jgi:uncharacterized protein YgiM (DUF1202 family)